MSRVVAILGLMVCFHSVGTADPQPAETGLPVGKWRIEFANGVIETCEINRDGGANETEPLRTSVGKAILKEGSVEIKFEDDRVERWTKVGSKWVVEHWFPSTSYPELRPVLGIAKLAK